MKPPALSFAHESWPLREAFTISRGAKTAAEVIVVTLREGSYTGRGEAVPYARYGESIDGVILDIAALRDVTSRAVLSVRMTPGAARNALDCAMWDLEAKRSGRSAVDLAGIGALHPVLTCFTLSLGTPEAMAAKARDVAHLPLLKLKLGGAGDDERMAAVRQARPDARLVADANEAWTVELAPQLFAAAAAARVELIEQPFPADGDEILRGMLRPVPVCADESLHTRADLPRIAHLYDAINIKLDKAGGLTEALALKEAARTQGLKIMVGSMVATSLAVAPAMLLAQGADWVDLDGPLLLAKDREHGLANHDGIIEPPEAALWG